MDLSTITFNVSADFLSPPGVSTWAERKTFCVQALRQAQPGIIGLQEVMPRQFEYFQAQLPAYRAITVSETARDESVKQAFQALYGQPLPDQNEIVLFFRKAELSLTDHGHWWLSPTPDHLSVGFGNIAPRLVLWGHIQHHASGREVIVFNTHLDHRCTLPMVKLCRKKLAAFFNRKLPLIFMGDLNVNPTQAEYALLTSDGWHDSYAVSSELNAVTFAKRGRIDHIFYRGACLKPQKWTRLFSPDPQRRLSDHDPVYVRFSLE